MNISDLINALEKLAFQIISWIILIPKTIFWILAAPNSMVEYIDAELDKKAPSFKSFISPIFLFLFVGLGPVVLESMIKLPELRVEGQQLALTDTTYTYKAKIDVLSDWTDFRTESYIYEYVWSYEENDSSIIIETFLYDNYIPEENEIELTFHSADTFELQLNVYAYQLGDAEDADSELNYTYSNNNELEPPYGYVAIDTLPFSSTLFAYAFDTLTDLKEAEKLFTHTTAGTAASKTQLTEQQLYSLGLALMLLPLFFSVSLIIKNDEKITVPTLKRYLYAQCALFTPTVLIFNFGILTEAVLPTRYVDDTIVFLMLLGLISIIWLVIVESKIYDLTKKEVGGILFGLPVLVVAVLMFFIEALVEFSNFKWIIWLFMLAILVPMVWGIFLKNKDFSEDDDDEDTEASGETE